MNFIADFRACYSDFLAGLRGDDPIFVSRIGGSDTDAVVDYCRIRSGTAEAMAAHASRFIPTVSKFNGFYDRTGSVQVYQRYCEELIRTYEQSRVLFFGNSKLLSLYFANTLNRVFYKENFENKESLRAFVQALITKRPDLKCYPYQFAEKMIFDDWTMFRAFTEGLAGKTVLVISSFAESIRANYHRRHSFFKKGYNYPEFNLKLVNTPITYAGLPPEMYPDTDWFATLKSLRDSVSREEFDIALLACGSYAMPLGVLIERELKRKAVYVGGVLQLYFGIMGRRYQDPYFLDQINPDKYIHPVEGERYLKHAGINRETANEAFGAYF